MNGKRRARRLAVEKPARIARRALSAERPRDVLDLRISDLVPRLEAGVLGIETGILRGAAQQRRENWSIKDVLESSCQTSDTPGGECRCRRVSILLQIFRVATRCEP